jgi:hypothetical protein
MVWIITAWGGIQRRFISCFNKERYNYQTRRNQYILPENHTNDIDCHMRLPAGQWTILSSWRNQG